jgi:hypothetical protein
MPKLKTKRKIKTKTSKETKNKSLYSKNKQPSKSIKGTGFRDKAKALETLKIIKNLDKVKQMQIVLTMYYRAEYHPNKTTEMKEAQVIFKNWLIKNGYR